MTRLQEFVFAWVNCEPFYYACSEAELMWACHVLAWLDARPNTTGRPAGEEERCR